MYTIGAIIIIIGFSSFLFLNQKSFGRQPKGERLKLIKDSKNYVNGQFVNQINTQMMTGEDNMFTTMIKFLFNGNEEVRPREKFLIQKSDIKSIPIDKDFIIWFGHSSYLIQINGKRILVDPVFYKASPVALFNKPFEGTDIFKAEDMPKIDFLIITHDHWDHLDYETVIKLKDKTSKVIVPLGVGEHFEYWNFPSEMMRELDWYENTSFDGFKFYCLPARHFSGRGLKRNKTLWASFMIETSQGENIYIGGDSGYGPHFKEIGEKFPNISLAFLENGQYNENWSKIHTLPSQLGKAANEIGAEETITVHHSKFALSYHPWNEPLKNEIDASMNDGFKLRILNIGEIEYINR